MIGGAKGIGIGIDFGIPNQYCRATNKPYIEKDVLDSLRVVASAYGKSNNDADRSIVKNLVDASNPFIISNAAYEGMSGYNGYPVVFGANKTWANESNGYVTSITSNTIHITNVLNAGLALLYSYVKYNGNLQNIKEIPPFKIEIKGLEGRSKFIYKCLVTSDATKETNLYLGNGTHELPKSFLPTEALINNAVVGFSISPIEEGVTNFLSDITIKVLPEYEGAFVTDGIDGLITSTKTVQEMLGGSNELTIVSMAHQVKDSTNNVSFTNYIRGSANGYFRNIVNNYGKTGIYGYTSSDFKSLSVINNILGDKNDYTSNGDNRDSIINGNFSVQGYSYNDGNNTGDFSSVAWYWTIIANKVLTTDQINQVIDYFNLDRTLNPDILCNIIKQGITNDNHADFNDKLIDYSGNGRDVQMNNLAWKGGSGIAAKPFETIKDYTILSDEARQKLTIYNEFSYKVKSNTPNHYWIVQSIIKDNTSYQVTIITDKDCYWINSTSFTNNEGNKESIRKEYLVKANTPTQVTICGLNEFEYPEGIEPTTAVSYVNLNYAGEVTVTFIPSCKGGLLLDGVNDFGQFVGDLELKDYTFIADRAYSRIAPSQVPFIASTQTNGQAPFLMEYLHEDTYVYPHSFGTTTKTTNLNIQRQISYQSTYVYNGNSISKGTSVDTGDGLTIGNSGSTGLQYSPLCLWSLMLFPYSMSEFLIERQLKKHKLGTLYPDMVEFRPIVKSNNKWDIIEIWQGDKSLYKPAINDDKTGIYLKKDSTIGIYVKPYVGQKVSEIVYNGVSYTDLKLNNNGFYYKVVPITKSPQKITMTIEQDENYVKFEPVITSNVEYVRLDFYLNNYQKRINIGDYIPKDAYLRADLYLKNNVDELTVFTFNGVNINYRRSSVDDRVFNIGSIYNYDSPQEVNITIDEYIRYEDIAQPYPVVFQIKDRNTNQIYSWGDKIKVGSSIQLTQGENPNLLNGLYSVQSYEYEGETYTYNQLKALVIIITKSGIQLSCNKVWTFDDNEPKCILSPRLLRIPNSSYKILGYIPDISGHGNNGVINNSAYAEGSGVNEDGSYQFDGVDDFITIPTLSRGGKQVLMKVNWNSLNHVLYDQRNNAEAPFCIVTASGTIAYNQRNVGGNTYIDGILNNHILVDDLQAITHNIVLNNDYNVANSNSFIGTNYTKSIYAQMSLYDFMLFDEISTDDKILELNEYVGIEAKVELPPYYWDNYGKTNLDEDKATIQQRGIAKGDYDLTNYNHAYDKMSGYGGYEFAKFDNTTEWDLFTSDSIDIISRNGYSVTLKSKGGSSFYGFRNIRTKGFQSNDIPFKVRANKSVIIMWDVYGNAISDGRFFGRTIMSTTLNPDQDTTISLKHMTEEELNELGMNKDGMYYGIWFDLSTLAVNEEVTIEMLPLYPNSLVYDGVEDFSDNKNVPIIDDFTVIAKRLWLEENTSDKPFIIKGDTLYPDGNKNAFLFEYSKLSTYSFGQNNKYNESVVPSLISWATPTSYNGTTSLVRGSAIDTVGIDIAHATKIVLYKLILYPKTIPLLQINFLKNLMEKDEIIDLNNKIFIQ